MTNQPSKITALPKRSTQQLNFRERSLGRRTQLDIDDAATPSKTDLAGDTFFTLMKRDPQFRETVPEGREVNRRLLDWMMGNSGFEKARMNAAGNLPAAMVATRMMHAHLTSDEVYEEALKQQEAAEQAAQERDEQQAIQDAFEQAAQNAQNQGDSEAAQDAKEKAQDAAQKAAQANMRYEQAKIRMEQEIEKIEKSPIASSALYAASQEAADEAGEVAQAMKGWGDEAGTAVKSDPSAALEFLRMYDDKLKRIAEHLGRMRGIALNTRAKVAREGYRPTGAELSKDLTRTFPDQLARLSDHNHPVLRSLAVKEWVDNGLMSWRMTGDAEEKGNFYFLLDESGSMWGTEEIIAKGCMLGICQAAKAEGRKYRGGAFAHSMNNIRPLNSEQSWQEHMEWASSFLSGGTSFDAALTYAMDAMEADGEEAQSSDVVIVTDGYAPLSNDVKQRWLELADRTGARLMYVPICTSIGSSPIDEIADEVFNINSFEDGGETFAQRVSQFMR